MLPIRTIALLAGLAALAAGPVLMSIRALQPPAPAPLNPSRHAYVGIDTSDSFLSHLPEAAHAVTGLAASLGNRDFLTVYAVGRQANEVYDAPAPESADAFQDLLVSELGTPPAKRGTFPALFWQAVAGRTAKDSGPVSVAYLSDADNDDQAKASAGSIRRSAGALAKNRNVESVTIFAAPENWAVLRSEFSSLGARLHLVNCRSITPERLAGSAGQ